MQYDKHAVGVYKMSPEKLLVGHIPIKLSMLLDYFLQGSEVNRIISKVSGKIKPAVGLIVPAHYIALIRDVKVANTLVELFCTLLYTYVIYYRY